jgi:hypothetical protein
MIFIFPALSSGLVHASLFFFRATHSIGWGEGRSRHKQY